MISTRLRLCCAFRQDDFPINFRQNVDDRTFSNFELEKGEIKVGHEIHKTKTVSQLKKNGLTFQKSGLTFKKKPVSIFKMIGDRHFRFFSQV